MVYFYIVLAITAAVVGGYAAPATEGFQLLARAEIPPDNTNNGYYYYQSTGNADQCIYTNGPGGQYTLTWAGNNGTCIGGKGWNPGTFSRVINYAGVYKPNGNSIFGVYGWTRSPLIEYYITESYGTYNPAAGAIKKGSVTCNGATYSILQITRVNQPSIDGAQTFQQFWSVRGPMKAFGRSINGTIDTACHFNAWSNLGMKLGTNYNYQIVATEGYYSSGTSTVTVS